MFTFAIAKLFCLLFMYKNNKTNVWKNNLPNACWLAGICVNIFRKYGEHTDNTSRWAFTKWPSAAKVTSTKSPLHKDSWKPADKLELKLFQHSENCSSSAILVDAWLPTHDTEYWRTKKILLWCSYTYNTLQNFNTT